jgi:hypothetical protein
MPLRPDTLALREGIGVLRGETMSGRIHAVVEMVVQAASSQPHLTTRRSRRRRRSAAAERERYV